MNPSGVKVNNLLARLLVVLNVSKKVIMLEIVNNLKEMVAMQDNM
jgi:peroxiredoxin